MTYRKYNTKKAFTLIEILMIVSIIALLASIVLVNSGTWKLRAQRSAVLTESSSALRAIETCVLETDEMYCGGSTGTVNSSYNCAGDSLAIPVAGTALCGDSATGTFTDAVWPELSKNGYVYAGSAGSAISHGMYSFGLYRDQDGDSLPDNNNVICCSNAGCKVVVTTSDAGAYCRSLAGMSTIED